MSLPLPSWILYYQRKLAWQQCFSALLLELFGSCKLRKAGRPCAVVAAAANPAQSAPRRCRRHCRRPCYCLIALYCSAVKQYILKHCCMQQQSKQPTLHQPTAYKTAGRRQRQCGGARRRIAHVACGVASTFLAVAQCLHLNTTLSAFPTAQRRVWRPLVLLLPLGHSCQCQKKACLYDS